MIREFTEKEKQILRDGLNEDNYSTHDILMMGFNEEQILRRMDEEEEEEPKDRFPTADERWPRAGKPINVRPHWSDGFSEDLKNTLKNE